MKHILAGKSTELWRFFKSRASFVSGVSWQWHSTRVLFGLKLVFFSLKFADMAEIYNFCKFCKTAKPVKL
jgi:hypothetical protein